MGIISLASHFYYAYSKESTYFDLKLYDLLTTTLKKKTDSQKDSNVVIVDIDEKSLKTFGQWPWPRILIAKMLHKVNTYHPNAIALDIMFAEKDRTSPKEIQSFYKNFLNINSSFEGIPKSLYNNDAILSSALTKTNSVLGMYLSNDSIYDKKCNRLNYLDVNTKKLDIESFANLLCNTTDLNSDVTYSGIVNTYLDEDAILRRMPLFFKYKENILPTLSLATLLSINDDLVRIDTNHFKVLNHLIKTDSSSNVLLNFYPQNWYKKISAIDLLSNKVPKNFLTGKVILIGSSATSLHDQVIVSGGKKIIGVQVHATMIDNILNEDYFVQKEFYKILNVVVSLVLILFLLYLLISKRIYIAFSVATLSIIIAVSITVIAFNSAQHISISYFLIPFLLHLFFISLLYIAINAYDKHLLKEELNRLHIAQLDQKVKEKTADLVQTHKHIQENIDYASLIQNALLPEESLLQNYTQDSFVYWQPRDVVGGDIYLISELKSQKEILIMVIDGAGHGVSGAFITVLIKAIESQIITKINNKQIPPSPALILQDFNNSIKTMLNQHKDSESNVGFDGGVLYYNKQTKKCTYAGAKTPLYILDEDNFQVIKSDRKNVGYIRTKVDQTYTDHSIRLKNNTQLYISTDGLYDQYGENQQRFSKKSFENIIQDTYKASFPKQKDAIIRVLKDFQGSIEQSDDITVLGLKF